MNRLRLWFHDGKPREMDAMMAISMRRWLTPPSVHGCGGSSGLYEPAPLAACGCRGSWSCGEYVDGAAGHVLRFGWWLSVTHSQACRKAEA